MTLGTAKQLSPTEMQLLLSDFQLNLDAAKLLYYSDSPEGKDAAIDRSLKATIDLVGKLNADYRLAEPLAALRRRLAGISDRDLRQAKIVMATDELRSAGVKSGEAISAVAHILHLDEGQVKDLQHNMRYNTKKRAARAVAYAAYRAVEPRHPALREDDKTAAFMRSVALLTLLKIEKPDKK